jgi:peptide/nickel transport system permease protein
MLNAAQSMRVLSHEWWLWAPPGAAIVLMVLAINFIGESLASTLNPAHSALLRDLRARPRKILGLARTTSTSTPLQKGTTS